MTDNRRILVVDDMPSIHDDFRKILTAEPAEPALSDDEALLFGLAVHMAPAAFDVDFAYQGRDALDMVVASRAINRPYALAIVDMRMPPGWDGVETIERLWQEDEDLQVVICTAYSDFSWESVMDRLKPRDGLAVLHKPFGTAQAVELAASLTAKWNASALAASCGD